MDHRHLRIVASVGAVALFLFFLPYLILGEGASIRIFDNLDGEIIYKMMVARPAYWLNYHTTLPEIMNGLPRFCIASGLNFTTLLFGLLPPFAAYMVNDLLMRIVGFIGMFLLMRRYLFREESQLWLVALFSAAYIFIPFNTIYGLTDLGQPLLLYAFLNILQRRSRWSDYACLLLFPFFSFFFLSGFFAGVALGVIWLVNAIRMRRINRNGLLILIGYAASSFLVEYNLIIPIFEHFHSHREEIVFASGEGNFLLFCLRDLWQTQIAPGQFLTLPIWMAVAVTLCAGRPQRVRMGRALLLFGSIFIAIALLYYFCPVIKGFRLSRFYHLLPLCWMLLFGYALKLLYTKGKGFRAAAIVILIFQSGLLYVRDVNYATGNRLRNAVGLTTTVQYPSYRAFFAVEQFGRVKQFIGEDPSHYRVVHVGILPAVGQYNGFYTLDSYQNNYPLAYKHQFYSIERNELSRNRANEQLFRDFGNWCYIFPAEVSGIDIVKGNFHKHCVLHDLRLDAGALRAMHCRYLLSSARIEHCERSGLKFLRLFEDDQSYWDVWLYEVIGADLLPTTRP